MGSLSDHALQKQDGSRCSWKRHDPGSKGDTVYMSRLRCSQSNLSQILDVACCWPHSEPQGPVLPKKPSV